MSLLGSCRRLCGVGCLIDGAGDSKKLSTKSPESHSVVLHIQPIDLTIPSVASRDERNTKGKTMSRITISNDFTNRSTIVDTSKPLTAAKVLAIRRRLCSDDCRSGDDLGARGKQQDGYSTLLDRAQQALMS